MINPGPKDLFRKQQEATGVSSSQSFHKYTPVSNTVRAHRVTGVVATWLNPAAPEFQLVPAGHQVAK